MAATSGAPWRGDRPLRVVRGLELRFGSRTYVMGILNITPDSFSGDGLLAEPHRPGGDPGADGDRAADGDRPPADDREAAHGRTIALAVAQAVRMVAEGADILDVGGESTRPGHRPVSESEEARRVVGVIRAIRARLPDVPISIDTSKPAVAEAALTDGADILNDVAAVTSAAALAPVAAAHRAPYILMHGRHRPRYRDVVGEVVDDLRRAVELAVAAGCARDELIVDPGIGFGKTAEQNLELLSGLGALRALGRPIIVGASRKSTIGRVLGLPVEERLEGTLATTALAVAAGVDIVRVHDVSPNVRVARMSDAIIRGGWHEPDSVPGHEPDSVRGTLRARPAGRTRQEGAADGSDQPALDALRGTSRGVGRGAAAAAARGGRPRRRGWTWGPPAAPTPWPTPSTTRHSWRSWVGPWRGAPSGFSRGWPGRSPARRSRPTRASMPSPSACASWPCPSTWTWTTRRWRCAGSARPAEPRPPRLSHEGLAGQRLPGPRRYWLAGLVPSSICRSRTSSPRRTRRVSVSRGRYCVRISSSGLSPSTLIAVDVRDDVAILEAGLVRRAAREDGAARQPLGRLDERAIAEQEATLVLHDGRERGVLDAHPGTTQRLALHGLLHDRAGEVDGDGEADALRVSRRWRC